MNLSGINPSAIDSPSMFPGSVTLAGKTRLRPFPPLTGFACHEKHAPKKAKI